MKKILFFLITAVFLSSAVAMAESCCKKDNNCCSTESCIQKKAEKLQKTLNLEDSQLPQVKAIIKTKMESKQAIKDKMEQEMDVVSSNFQASMNQILDADQQATLQKMMDEYKDQKKCKKRKRFLLF